MSGLWTATAPRVPWDRDGSILVTWDSSNIPVRNSQAAMNFLNGESGSNANTALQNQWNTGGTIPNFVSAAVLFSFPRDVHAVFSFGSIHPNYTNYIWQFSLNTTNGVDGAWSTISSQIDSPFVKPYYRDPASLIIPTQSSLTRDVQGVRVWYGGGNSPLGTSSVLRCFHVYGSPGTGATSQRLEFWHPTLDQVLPASWMDFGSFPRSTSSDKTFRVKNLSPTKTANSIVLQAETLSDTTPIVEAQFSLSSGGPFTAIQEISAIASGAVSAVQTLRRVTPVNAALSTWTARVNTTVGSWT